VPAPVCLIVNPHAGGGRAARAQPAVERALRGHGLQLESHSTRDLEHARSLAHSAAATDRTVVTLGGDGLVGAVADVLRRHDSSLLGILPGGRGNDLVRVLGIPRDPVAACAVIANGTPRALDLGEVDGRAFVSIASAGFDSDANRIANQAPAWLGGLVYAYGALVALTRWRPTEIEIEIDPPGEPRVFSAYSVAAANSGWYGGGMKLAPDARLDDGLLDIVVIGAISRLRFLTLLPRVFAGSHVRLRDVHVLRGREVQISADRAFTLYADGDPIAELPARVRALSGAIRVLTPSPAS
jgi:YegS/Rv2252/BmrU family lipid kinase